MSKKLSFVEKFNQSQPIYSLLHADYLIDDDTNEISRVYVTCPPNMVNNAIDFLNGFCVQFNQVESPRPELYQLFNVSL